MFNMVRLIMSSLAIKSKQGQIGGKVVVLLCSPALSYCTGYTLQVCVDTYPSGFDPSDWLIWTDFVGGNFRQRVLFFGKSYRENKNCSGSENTPNKL